MPLPEVGFEAAGGVPISFAWPAQRLAIALDLEQDETDALLEADWKLIDPQSDALATQVIALTEEP